MRPTTRLNRTTIISLAILLTGLNSCGFQLRGANLEVFQNAKIYVQSSGADKITSKVKRQLSDAGAKSVASASDADYVITLSEESFDTEILSVSPTTGKAENYEVTYTAQLKIFDRVEQTTLEEPISATRDYSFDDEAVLGKAKEEAVLKKEIIEQMAASIFRQLRSIIQ